MNYQLVDNGASIRIVSDAGEKLLIKRHVTQVRVINGQTIKIDTGQPLSAVYISFALVTNPSLGNAVSLRDWLNIVITSCVCVGSTAKQNPPG